jgi:hypothetical protein
MRRRNLRILTLAAGSYAGLIAAHVLDYRLVVRDPLTRARALAATGHGYLARAVELGVAACLVAAVAALAFGFVARRPSLGSARFGRLVLAFGLIQSGGFLLLESTERVATGTISHFSLPLAAAGVALQLVVAAFAALVVWFLGRTGARIARALESRYRARAAKPPRALRPRLAPAFVRRAPFARCVAGRAPPLLVR